MLDMELWKDEWSDDEDYYLRYSYKFIFCRLGL